MYAPQFTSESITILHVDDDPSFTSLATAFLKRIDDEFSVIEVHDGEEALERMETDSVDCIVCDYDMPGKNGIELLEVIRERHGELPFILLTGKGSEEIASEAISAGVSDYLQKSGNSEQYELLANRIRTLTEKHQTEHHVQQVYEAINEVDEGVSLLNPDGEYLYVNRAYASIFGYDRDELVGRHWKTIYRSSADANLIQQEVLADLQSGEPWEGTTRQARKDGSDVFVKHTLAYTSKGMMACLMTELDIDPAVADGPIVDPTERSDGVL